MLPSPVLVALKRMSIAAGTVSVLSRLHVVLVFFLQAAKPKVNEIKIAKTINFFMVKVFELAISKSCRTE